MRKFTVEVTHYVTVEVNDESVLSRVDLDWRERFYDLRSDAEVVEHLASNFIRNGIVDIGKLEGWADVGSPTAVVFSIEDADTHAEEVVR